MSFFALCSVKSGKYISRKNCLNYSFPVIKSLDFTACSLKKPQYTDQHFLPLVFTISFSLSMISLIKILLDLCFPGSQASTIQLSSFWATAIQLSPTIHLRIVVFLLPSSIAAQSITCFDRKRKRESSDGEAKILGWKWEIHSLSCL